MIYKVGATNSEKYIGTLLSRLEKYELTDLDKEDIQMLNSFAITSNKN